MATFPDISPNFGASKSSQPAIRKVQFGDGYESRILMGLNQNPKVWDLSFVNITETDSDTIETFLDARAADSASFDWSPPDETTTYKWVCESWSKEIPYANRATIQATFRQVFEP
jgi:phage-related protein|tara:strand:- start:286 stop:630 length:345 start_codon:yes stop_codon:yes gene_type:complete